MHDVGRTREAEDAVGQVEGKVANRNLQRIRNRRSLCGDARA